MSYGDEAVTPSRCPYCDYAVDCASNLYGPESPSEGDFSICFKCGKVCAFTTDLALRKLNEQEVEEAALSPELQKAIRAWKAVDHIRRRRN